MDDLAFLAIENLEEHNVRGEARWTGTVSSSGGSEVNILILRVGAGLLAVRNRCPHRDISLLRGRLDPGAGTLECPSHGWELSLDGSELRGRQVTVQDGRFFMAR
jgi:nitrite reductase/ring-hydroxylating ferredoxin subunit